MTEQQSIMQLLKEKNTRKQESANPIVELTRQDTGQIVYWTDEECSQRECKKGNIKML